MSRFAVLSGVGRLGAACVGFGLTALVSVGAAQAQTCAAAYHGALGGIRADTGRDLGSIATLMRRPEPQFSGRWLFAPNKGARAAPARGERVCAESVRRNGRPQCVRWEAVANVAAPAASLAATREELAVQKFVEDTVAAKGAIPEFGNNGRYYFIFARVTAELSGYVNQPANPALCSGAPQFLDFLLEQIAPVKKRLDDVAGIDATARSAADRRVAAVAQAAADLQAARAAADAAAVAGANEPAKPADASPVAAAPPVVRAAGGDAATLLDELTGIVGLPATPGATMAKLQRLRSALAAPGDPGRAKLTAHALAAARAIEAGIYTDHIRQRFASLERAVYGTVGDVRAAHGRQCTCGD